MFIEHCFVFWWFLLCLCHLYATEGAVRVLEFVLSNAACFCFLRITSWSFCFTRELATAPVNQQHKPTKKIGFLIRNERATPMTYLLTHNQCGRGNSVKYIQYMPHIHARSRVWTHCVVGCLKVYFSVCVYKWVLKSILTWWLYVSRPKLYLTRLLLLYLLGYI